MKTWYGVILILFGVFGLLAWESYLKNWPDRQEIPAYVRTCFNSTPSMRMREVNRCVSTAIRGESPWQIRDSVVRECSLAVARQYCRVTGFE